MDISKKIFEKMQQSNIKSSGYRITDTHFENGQNLHSQQYYFIKKFFQDSENCTDLSLLLVDKLNDLKITSDTTLIGYRNYVSSVLSKAVDELKDVNYAIVEDIHGSFVWQNYPTLKRTIVIVLPSTCTFTTFIKLRKFLTDSIKQFDLADSVKISDALVSIFLILESSLEKKSNQMISVKELSNDPDFYELKKLYSAFNWKQIHPDVVTFGGKENDSQFRAYSLVRLYSKMHLPEKCPICFPDTEKNSAVERPLFPTHRDYETPNLIFDFPDFGNKPQQYAQDFITSFDVNDNALTTILPGHITISNNDYINYIRGNAFYQKNKDSILKHFESLLLQYIDENDSRVVFITAENKFNSTFLEDIASYGHLKSRTIGILRFKQSHEYVENFFSLHSDAIYSANKVVYFEEVLTAGKTFTQLNEYLRYQKNVKTDLTEIFGFDLLLTLVDRTTSSIRRELENNLRSKAASKESHKLLSYFSLNVPNISAKLWGDPLQEKISVFKSLIDDCHLDFLKLSLCNKLQTLRPKELVTIESEISKRKNNGLRYFPFRNNENKLDQLTVDIYWAKFTESRYTLLRLYLTHELSFELSITKYKKDDFFDQYKVKPENFIRDLIKVIIDRVRPRIADFFVANGFEFSPGRNIEIEEEILHDELVRILSQSPFNKYKDVYESIFKYCLIRLDHIQQLIKEEGLKSFAKFRRLKFYIRRSLDLNSNFIISKRFLEFIKDSYDREIVEKIKAEYYHLHQKSLDEYNNNGSQLCKIESDNHLYRYDQITHFFSFLIRSYKELINKNPYRSIKLEELINSSDLLPEIIKNENKDVAIEDLLADPYYHFTGIIKAENIPLLSELKELHKKNLTKDLLKDANNKLKTNFKKYYFSYRQKHDPIIINSQKFVEKSRHYSIRKNFQHILDAHGNMLSTIKALHDQRISKDKKDLHTQIGTLLDKVLEILQPGLGSPLQYAFCIEYRSKTDNDGSNLYTIVSNNSKDSNRDIVLTHDGLIYNLLYGLSDDLNLENEQTLLPAIKSKSGRFASLKEQYYVRSDKSQLGTDSRKFHSLVRGDCYNSKTRKGLKMLDEANMALFFRLSNLITPDNREDDYRVEGQAVLVVTTTEAPTISNFLDFMSTEKVRLLLLIKEELLEYFQKQFASGAFIDFLGDRQRRFYQGNLRHGLASYIDSLQFILTQVKDNIETAENIALFEIITNAMKGQLKAIDIDLSERHFKSYKKEDFVRLFKLIFETPLVADRSIKFSELNLSGFEWQSIRTHHHLVVDVIVPEIIINMKKYSPLYGDKFLLISSIEGSNRITFKNKIPPRPNKNEYDKFEGGLSMIKLLMSKLDLAGVYTNKIDEYFTLILDLNRKSNEKDIAN